MGVLARAAQKVMRPRPLPPTPRLVAHSILTPLLCIIIIVIDIPVLFSNWHVMRTILQQLQEECGGRAVSVSRLQCYVAV